ncbi:Nicotinate phosphoribosyltransferase pncB-type [Trinorchestia longiramus]|nr:Nicotinate phosphoribosyltransferase pncB-type [Trinorchestia longiramus]
MYQINMAYAYWKSGKLSDVAVFDLFFRKAPFGGEFTIFAGLDECITFIKNFKYTASDLAYLRQVMPESVEEEFFECLSQLSAKDVTVYAVDEGNVVFPRVPLISLKGPLIVIQLLETTLLNLVNYASLVATNAARYRMASGPKLTLLEFGLRRAQGPDGGGFDGTSNVLAGKLYGIPVKGTHAHAFVSSFAASTDLKTTVLRHRESGESQDVLQLAVGFRRRVCTLLSILQSEANDGEMAAFCAFAIAFPSGFVALVDTYDVVKSGIVNFCGVALALHELGYRPLGVRIDSGDLAYLSTTARSLFARVAHEFNLPWFEHLTIVASNDINEETIISLNEQGHKIDSFGIGTHLVTCQRQPALGCVFKLVQVNGQAKIKLSQDVEKVTCPGEKKIYRLFGSDGRALIDLMQLVDEQPPQSGERVLCRHPFQESKRAYVSPATVQCLHKVFWRDGEVQQQMPTLEQVRGKVRTSLASLRQDHKRNLNPTPYKVGVSDNLYTFMHELWLQSAPIGELF